MRGAAGFLSGAVGILVHGLKSEKSDGEFLAEGGTAYAVGDESLDLGGRANVTGSNPATKIGEGVIVRDAIFWELAALGARAGRREFRGGASLAPKIADGIYDREVRGRADPENCDQNLAAREKIQSP